MTVTARFRASLIASIGTVLGLPQGACSQCPASGSISYEYARATLVFVADVEDVQLREDRSERVQCTNRHAPTIFVTAHIRQLAPPPAQCVTVARGFRVARPLLEPVPPSAK